MVKSGTIGIVLFLISVGLAGCTTTSTDVDWAERCGNGLWHKETMWSRGPRAVTYLHDDIDRAAHTFPVGGLVFVENTYDLPMAIQPSIRLFAWGQAGPIDAAGWHAANISESDELREVFPPNKTQLYGFQGGGLKVATAAEKEAYGERYGMYGFAYGFEAEWELRSDNFTGAVDHPGEVCRAMGQTSSHLNLMAIDDAEVVEAGDTVAVRLVVIDLSGVVVYENVDQWYRFEEVPGSIDGADDGGEPLRATTYRASPVEAELAECSQALWPVVNKAITGSPYNVSNFVVATPDQAYRGHQGQDHPLSDETVVVQYTVLAKLTGTLGGAGGGNCSSTHPNAPVT